MKPYILLLLSVIVGVTVSAQQKDTTDLATVTINAYEHNKSGSDIAAPVAKINTTQLQYFANTSLVNAINTVPGVRMEERSPGSYRLNIRGSSLRSPFGVRNIKMYYNGIPFTDAGGNTYLNQFSNGDFESIEILKGPGSSLYGAGTGGVLLADGMNRNATPMAQTSFTAGSYGLLQTDLKAQLNTGSAVQQLKFNYLKSDGYRDHSAMNRTTFSWQNLFKVSKKYTFFSTVLFGDLFYETPGALNKLQYENNPEGARPAAGIFPGAAENKAAISQKTIWAGMGHHYTMSNRWKNTTSIYLGYTQFKNPSIRNYEKRQEPNTGARTVFNYTHQTPSVQLTWSSGAELQWGNANIDVYKNNKGNPDSLQTSDEIANRLYHIFTQAVVELKSGWAFTGGIGLNNHHTKITRTSVIPNIEFNSNYNVEWSPRLAVIKHLSKQWKLYGVVSKGFSPPSNAELLPSNSIINTDLQAEQGWNYEIGVRSVLLHNRLQLSLNVYQFNLTNAIVQRRDGSGADYFTNAGGTIQKGLELSGSYRVIEKNDGWLKQLFIELGYTYSNYKYRDFKQLNNNYGGNNLPGIPPHYITAGIHGNIKDCYIHINYTYSDTTALNDANSAKADAFHLLQFKMGWKKSMGKVWNIHVFAGIDNVLNQQYSLGNDINAAAGRYFNAAPAINYYGGLGLGYRFHR